MNTPQNAPQQVNVTFRNHVVEDEIATRTKGRPIFTEMEVCDITFPGNNKTVATFPAHDAEPNATRESVAGGGGAVTYAMLYSKQYLAFKEGAAQPTNGTLLSEAPFLTEAKRRELRALRINTVEQLASLDGTPLKQIGMGGRELKNQAQAYLDSAAGSADLTGLAAKIASLESQLAEERRMREDAEARVGSQAGARSPNTSDDEQPAATVDLDAMADDELKDFIAEQTGERPRGNPKRETLLAAAHELAQAA